MLLDRVRAYMQANGMLEPGGRAVVSVSGGPDSVALLHLLHRLAPELQVELHVFHMDHGLRGEASEQDGIYVRRLSDRLGLPCTLVTLGPEVLKRRSGSLQANARLLRYEELEALARRIGARWVALGHNRDDQTETVLMRFLRGAGTRGLAGIPPRRNGHGVTFVRPLLDTPRREIENYCLEHELFPRQDESNVRPDYLRNKLRLELLPQLTRDYNPGLRANLAQVAAILRDEDALLEQLARQAFQRCRAEGEGIALLGSVLLAEPVALARRVVRLAAREATGPELDLGLPAVTQVLEAAAQAQGTQRLQLPGGAQVTVEYGVCRFMAAEEQGVQLPAEWALALVGETAIPELGLVVSVSDQGDPVGPFEAAFDLERLPGPLVMRTRRPGDRLWPTGMEGSKKLQDILVDAKVPQRLRDRVPLLASGDELLWVVGHRLDRRYLATPQSTRHLVIRVAAADPSDPPEIL